MNIVKKMISILQPHVPVHPRFPYMVKTPTWSDNSALSFSVHAVQVSTRRVLKAKICSFLPDFISNLLSPLIS